MMNSLIPKDKWSRSQGRYSLLRTESESEEELDQSDEFVEVNLEKSKEKSVVKSVKFKGTTKAKPKAKKPNEETNEKPKEKSKGSYLERFNRYFKLFGCAFNDEIDEDVEAKLDKPEEKSYYEFCWPCRFKDLKKGIDKHLGGCFRGCKSCCCGPKSQEYRRFEISLTLPLLLLLDLFVQGVVISPATRFPGEEFGKELTLDPNPYWPHWFYVRLLYFYSVVLPWGYGLVTIYLIAAMIYFFLGWLIHSGKFEPREKLCRFHCFKTDVVFMIP